MSKNSPSKHYQKTKKGFKQKLVKSMKSFLKKRKQKTTTWLQAI